MSFSFIFSLLFHTIRKELPKLEHEIFRPSKSEMIFSVTSFTYQLSKQRFLTHITETRREPHLYITPLHLIRKPVS